MFPKDLALAPLAGAVSDQVQDTDSAWVNLQKWHDRGTDLAFVYARTGGGLMQTGTARLNRLDPASLTLAASHCQLMVVLAEARYTVGPQQFFAPDFSSRFNLDGIAVALANQDWLFLTASLPLPALTLGALSIGYAQQTLEPPAS